jgi:hypothetical protein
MNYDLALMALEGLAKSPMRVGSEGGEVVIEGSPASFKELARLCLLLGGAHLQEEVELKPGVHVVATSQALRLRVAQ